MELRDPKNEPNAVRVACTGSELVEIDELYELQGELKSLSDDAFRALRDEILWTGFAFPIYAWRDPDDKLLIVGGHQRKRVLSALREEGKEVPAVPIVLVEAADIKEARRRVLQDVAQYGVVERQGLYEFMHLAELSLPDLETNFRIPDINIESFSSEFFEDLDGSEGDGAGGAPGSPEAGAGGAAGTSPGGEGGNATQAGAELYTKKITTPIYTPKGEEPGLFELYDTTKAAALSAEIEGESGIPAEVKTFLLHAARRHVVFNYEKIAEYYAHAEKDTQLLMEKSALVIIDFNKAIEEGFVVLSEKIADAYRAEAAAAAGDPEEDPELEARLEGAAPGLQADVG